jgi:hypothetical protein
MGFIKNFCALHPVIMAIGLFVITVKITYSLDQIEKRLSAIEMDIDIMEARMIMKNRTPANLTQEEM